MITESRRSNSLRQTLWLTAGFVVVLLILLIALLIKHRQLRLSHRMIVKRDMKLLAEPSCIISESKGCTDSDGHGFDQEKTDVTEKDQSNELFKRVEYVMSHDDAVFDENFSAVALAAKLHERQANVSNAIQTYAGMGFSSLLAEVRIKEACRRILDKENYGNYTVEAIAFSVGYKSRSHFTSVFKKVTGMSPSAYIRQARLAEFP